MLIFQNLFILDDNGTLVCLYNILFHISIQSINLINSIILLLSYWGYFSNVSISEFNPPFSFSNYWSFRYCAHHASYPLILIISFISNPFLYFGPPAGKTLPLTKNLTYFYKATFDFGLTIYIITACSSSHFNSPNLFDSTGILSILIY